MSIEKPRMRQVWRSGTVLAAYKAWQATYNGHTVTNVCPVWAYCEVLEKARKGF